MGRFFAICLPPVAFLTLLSVDYALVTPACNRGSAHWLHVAALVTLVIIVAMLVVAALSMRAARGDGAVTGATARDPVFHFLGTLGFASSALFALATLALWYALFVIPPCAS
jgi:hypothetical protein